MTSNIKSKSFQMTQKKASGVTARWTYSPGDVVMADEAHDEIWGSMSSIVIRDSGDDSSCMSEDEFAEDDFTVILLPEIKEVTALGVKEMAGGDDEDEDVSNQEPEDPTVLSTNNCYNSFRQLSLNSSIHSQSEEPKIKAPKRVSPPTPRNTLSLSRNSSHLKRRDDRLSQSQHNRSCVRNSMRNLLDF